MQTKLSRRGVVISDVDGLLAHLEDCFLYDHEPEINGPSLDSASIHVVAIIDGLTAGQY